MPKAGDLRDLVQGEVNRAWEERSRHCREAEEAGVRRREAEELAKNRRRHEEVLAQAAPAWSEQEALPWKCWKTGRATLKGLRG